MDPVCTIEYMGFGIYNYYKGNSLSWEGQIPAEVDPVRGSVFNPFVKKRRRHHYAYIYIRTYIGEVNIMPKMLDLFAGTRSVSREFEKAGWETYSVEWDKKFKNISLYADISKLTAQDIIRLCGGRPDVIWASPDCFVKGTLVWTDEGYKPIEEIKCKDMVLTHKGNYKRVYRTIKKNTYAFTKLKISGVEELLVTPNHPFYARKKISYTTHESGISKRVSYLSEPEWIDAEKLSTEYRVGIPINTSAIIPVWDGFVRQYCNSYGPTKCEIVNTLNPLMSCPDFWWIIGNYFADDLLLMI